MKTMHNNNQANDRFNVFTVEDLEAAPAPRLTYPIVIDDTLVKVCSEAPMGIWWQGKQWAVTEYGVECRDGTYSIPANELTYDLDGGTNHGWIEQMLSKGWVDMDDFRTAYFVALSMHGHQLPKEKIRKLRRHFTKQS